MNVHKKLLCTAGIALLLINTNLLAVEKSAVDIVKKVYQHLGSMDKYAFDAVVMDDVLDEKGVVVERFRQELSVKVDRPGKFRVDSKGDTRNRSSYLNEGIFTMIDHGEGYYGQLEAEKTINGTLDIIFDMYGIKAPLASLVYNDIHIWITIGDTPQIINYSIIDTTVEGNPRINTSISWNTNPKISDSDFIFKAPKGATQITVEAVN